MSYFFRLKIPNKHLTPTKFNLNSESEFQKTHIRFRLVVVGRWSFQSS